MLWLLTTPMSVGTVSNMKALPLMNRRVPLTPTAFAELVIWELPEPIAGSLHRYEYRLALVVEGACVVRYDNESGKGDHVHVGGTERAYPFSGCDRLIADFEFDARRWLDEHRGS